MASKYRKKFDLPENFYYILENYSREVLRDQPLDIIEFSYLYFKALEEVRYTFKTPILPTLTQSELTKAFKSGLSVSKKGRFRSL